MGAGDVGSVALGVEVAAAGLLFTSEAGIEMLHVDECAATTILYQLYRRYYEGMFLLPDGAAPLPEPGSLWISLTPPPGIQYKK